ncbi:MAG: substrate-binding domain-containing protein [Chloroflexi bacterium]|nr:substrate-binding domain-containing protein [Chloroflexota bacterium]
MHVWPGYLRAERLLHHPARGAQEAADRLNVGLVVEEAGNDAETQATQIQSLIDQGVDALLINPVDADAVVASIEAANAAGIPVFTVDRSANGGEVVAHIASDNFAGGSMAGNYLAEAIGEEGSVVELKGRENTSAAQQRGAGFNEAIGAFENIEIIAAETANFDRAEGQTVFAAILEANADIDGVFAHNDEMILGAVEAAREADRLADIRFVGFDAIEDALTALEAGRSAGHHRAAARRNGTPRRRDGAEAAPGRDGQRRHPGRSCPDHALVESRGQAYAPAQFIARTARGPDLRPAPAVGAGIQRFRSVLQPVYRPEPQQPPPPLTRSTARPAWKVPGSRSWPASTTCCSPARRTSSRVDLPSRWRPSTARWSSCRPARRHFAGDRGGKHAVGVIARRAVGRSECDGG